MDSYLERVSSSLTAGGWGDVRTRSYAGIIFDLVGSRRFSLMTKWNLAVKRVERFDRPTADTTARDFENMRGSARSIVWGSCFLLCLVADEVDSDLREVITTDGFGLLRGKGGGGHVLVVDLANKQVYGKVPSLPVDVHKYTKQAKELFEQAFAN